MTTTVVNRRTYSGEGVYIGRPSKWGNPFEINDNRTRQEAVDGYAEWLCWQSDLYDDIFTELRDQTLICWCAPQVCHGDVLSAIAEGDLVLFSI